MLKYSFEQNEIRSNELGKKKLKISINLVDLATCRNYFSLKN